MIRKVLFWLHLGAGVSAGFVILVMSATGVLLAYERQVTEWADGYRIAPPGPAAPRLGVEALAARVRESTGASPASITLRADREAPAALLARAGARRLRRPLLGARAGRRIEAGARLLPRGDGLAPVARSRRRTPVRHEGDHRSLQPALPVHRAERRGPVVAEKLDGASTFARSPCPREASPARRGISTGTTRSASGRPCRSPSWSRARSSSRIRGLPTSPTASRAASRRGAAREGPSAAGLRAATPPASSVAGLDRAWTRAEAQVPGWQSLSLRVPGLGRGALGVQHRHLGRGAAPGHADPAHPRPPHGRGREARALRGPARRGARSSDGFASFTPERRSASPGRPWPAWHRRARVMLVWTGLSLALRRLAGWWRRRSGQAAAIDEKAAA